MDEIKDIKQEIENLGLPIDRIWWEKRPFDEIMQFEFKRSLTQEEWERFEKYRDTLDWKRV